MTTGGPFLPYAGTSGHQDPATSRERAERNDSTGITNLWQRCALNAVTDAGPSGATALEVRTALHEMNPNRVSPSLTILHKAGRIVRLAERRDGHYVYVMPEHAGDRETVAPGRRAKLDVAALHDLHAEMVEAAGTAIGAQAGYWAGRLQEILEDR